MADFTVKGDTSLDASGFNGGISAMTVAGGNLISAFVQKVASAGVEIAKSFMSISVGFNAQLETYTTNFTTMLNGNAEAASTLLGELRELGASTPLAINDLTNAAQTLLSFGAADASSMTDTLRMIGDVSLGNAEKLKSLSLAYGQMVSTGKLQGQDLLQMINAGFNPLQELSEMGYGTMASLKEKMSDGAISVEMVQAAFEHATSEGGKFYNAMENASHTFTGQLSTLKDNATSLAGDITKGLTDNLSKNVLPMAIGWVDKLQTAFTQNGTAGMASAALDIAQGLIVNLMDAGQSLFDSGLEMIGQVAAGLVEGVPQFLSHALPMIEQFTANLRQNAGRLVDSGLNLIKNLVQGLIAALPDLIAYVPQIIINICGVINDNLPKILLTGASLIFELIKGIIGAVPDLIANFPKIVQAIVSVFTAFNWINLGKNLIKFIADGIKALFHAPVEIAKNIVNSIVKTFKDGFHWSDLGRNIIHGIKEGITATATLIKDAALNAAKAAFDAVKNFFGIKSPSRLMRDQIGKMLPAGMAVGVEESTPQAVSAARASATDMVDAARAAVDEAQYGIAVSASDAMQQAVAFSVPPAPVAATSATTNFYQTIHTHDSLSPAELTREAEDFMERNRWKNP